ncbi:uncharacterized protein EHS24_000117 [Apiotrichum porosum]|uniref:N-acetyltransferase domain-containing protein n=1 Tax=Apiotrichum porosum TaxID=105984 RepID=A0A427Y999_9TREE|nr:uncharacterized protein EHS24_000117 [Apiotrichum porosum]RSH87605.1 hypothetical protein EHS24_000117 [Apiotrichum porosum]
MAVTNVADLTIVPVTPAQARAASDNMYPHWGQPNGVVSTDEYIKAFDSIAATGPWDTAYTAWALVPRSDPTTVDILSHCQTFRRRAFVVQPGSDTVKQVTSYVVAHVFTPPEKRSMGMARHMLRLLHYTLAPKDDLPTFPKAWGAPPTTHYGDAAFSVLYSDVGPDFYQGCTVGEDRPGWVATPTDKRTWPVGQGESTWDPEWEAIDLAQAKQLEVTATAANCQAMPRTGDRTRTRVAFEYTNGSFRFSPVRGAVIDVASHKRKNLDGLTVGVRLGAPSGVERPYIIYTARIRGGAGTKKMRIAHVQHPVPFDALLRVARAAGAQEIELWGDDSSWDAEEHEVTREKEIPCLASYSLGKNVEWLWCEQ